MARLKNRARPVQETVGEIPERFYEPLTYFESDGPMTPSAFRAYSDDLRKWLESECGVSAKTSMSLAIQVMHDLNTLPAEWLNHAAGEGLGYREWEPWKPASVEESEPLVTQPENDPDVVLPVKSAYDELMEQIRRKPTTQ